MAASFLPLARVQLQGLSREELNGCVAVVLPADDQAEAERLAASGRIKVSNYPKPLSVRPENVKAADDPDFATPPLPFTVLQIARRDAAVVELCGAAARHDIVSVGNKSHPDEFAEALWRVYADVPPADQLPEDLVSVVIDTPGHWLHWVGLEQVAHHLIIESCDGVWRGYQSLSKRHEGTQETTRPFNSFGGVLVEATNETRSAGFSAREWLAPAPPGTTTHSEDAFSLDQNLLGVWSIDDGGYFEIVLRSGVLSYRQSYSIPFTVVVGELRTEGEWMVAELFSLERDLPHGSVRLKIDGGTAELNFMVHGERVWGKKFFAQSLRTLTQDLADERSKAAELDRLASEACAAAVEAEHRAKDAESLAKDAESLAKDAFTRVALMEHRHTEVSDAVALAREVDIEARPATDPAAHELWGGGRDLRRSEVAEVLELVLSLQEQAQVIAEMLREQVPAVSDAEVAEWAQGLLDSTRGGTSLSVVPAQPSSPRNTSGFAETEEVWVVSKPVFEPRCDLSVHSRLAFPFMRDFARLTGEFPDAPVFLNALKFAGWRDLEDEDGSRVGWTLRSLDMRNRSCDPGTELVPISSPTDGVLRAIT